MFCLLANGANVVNISTHFALEPRGKAVHGKIFGDICVMNFFGSRLHGLTSRNWAKTTYFSGKKKFRTFPAYFSKMLARI